MEVNMKEPFNIKEPLHEGLELESVFYGGEGYTIKWPTVESITVVMVPGHMANLPFAEVKLTNGQLIYLPLHNMSEIATKRS